MATSRKYRVLLVCSHPVQYASPVWRQMSAHPRLDIEVAYCSMQGAEAGLDTEFGREVKWDVPLLDGFEWTHVPNISPKPGVGRFFGLVNPALWTKVRKDGFDAVVIYTGYRYASFWIALAAAKLSGKPVLFGADASSLDARDGHGWKVIVKKLLLPRIFGLASQVIVPSQRTQQLMLSLGIPNDHISLTPYCVDNEWWQAQAALVDREAIRRSWEIPANSVVILFCAKLQPWKRPLDVLRAFAKANVPNSFLVFSGDGPLRNEIEQEAAALGIADRVRMLGFMNQTQLPAVYRASDLLVLPSEYEPFGVVVNEAMLCGCAVAVSDRVGAGLDLVGDNGVIYPCGEIGALANFFETAAADAGRLQQMGALSQERIATWSPRENISGLVMALDRAFTAGAK